jgi:uncharacterized membrane protein YjgN (DUF898 family)
MKRCFDFNLNAKRFFSLFIAFYIPWLILEIAISVQSGRLDAAAASGSVVLSLVLSLAMFLLIILFYVPILRKIVPAVSFNGQSFAFGGSIGKFFVINLLGVFLSIITLGIYGPWYITRIVRYLTGEVSYKQEALRFQGRGGKLFVILLVTLLVPILLLALFEVRLTGSTFGAPMRLNPFQSFMAHAFVWLIFLAFIAAYIYTVYRWYFTNLHYRDYSVHWDTTFWASMTMIWGQILLSVITLGVYFPAAYIRLYRYFCNRTRILREEEQINSLGFQGAAGRGFGLMWGQLLLTVITLGIYAPWAMAKVGKWYLANTYVEPS